MLYSIKYFEFAWIYSCIDVIIIIIKKSPVLQLYNKPVLANYCFLS